MSIWHRDYSLDELNTFAKGTLNEHMGIEIVEIGADYLKGSMPVDQRTKQPGGILHGGASAALAETLGSIAATMCVDTKTHHCVGLDINANHIRAARAGKVIGTASPVHVGRSTQVWRIDIADEADRMICASRLTLAVLSHR